MAHFYDKIYALEKHVDDMVETLESMTDLLSEFDKAAESTENTRKYNMYDFISTYYNTSPAMTEDMLTIEKSLEHIADRTWQLKTLLIRNVPYADEQVDEGKPSDDFSINRYNERHRIVRLANKRKTDEKNTEDRAPEVGVDIQHPAMGMSTRRMRQHIKTLERKLLGDGKNKKRIKDELSLLTGLLISRERDAHI